MAGDGSQAENLKLRAELAVLRDILDGVGSFVYTKDLDSRYTYANARTCALFGFPLDEILGQPDSKFFAAETAEQLRADDRRVLDTRQTQVRQDDAVLRATGETRTYLSTKAPMVDDRGQLIGICCVSTDITEQKRIEARLEESRLLLDTVLDHVEADIYMKDADGRYLYANQRVLNATGLTEEQILGHTDADIFPAEVATAYKRVDDLVFASDQPQQAEEEMPDGHGNTRYYWSTKVRVRRAGKPDFLIGFSTDITPLKKTEMALARSEARFRALFESSSEAVVVMTRTQFLDCNPAALAMLGVGSKAEFLRLTPADLSAPLQACGTPSAIRSAELIEETFAQGQHKVEWILQRYDNGQQIPAEAIATAVQLHDGPALLLTLRDLTERKRQEEQIARLAFHDALTQLPNRRLLHERLSQSLVQHQRSHQHGCVIYLDLDNFKPLNDRYGHVAGDQLLQEVGRRLVDCLRAQDTVARLGGDEFVALLIGLDPSATLATKQAEHVAEKIRLALVRPYLLVLEQDGAEKLIEHQCTASLGVTLFRPDDNDIDLILRRADDAMYRAKANGRNQVCFAAAAG